jgi:TetR/AcrR family transcriptional repressor of nem operon
MARTKEFSPEQALDAALELFWDQGYAATSVDDLCKCMGINRGSLYATFGDKHSLYLSALERYGANAFERIVASIEQAGSVREAVQRLLLGVIDAATADPARRGCFVMNTLIELAPHDPAAAERAAAKLAYLEDALRRLLRRGREAGEIAGDPDDLARFVVATLYGLIVLARAERDVDALRRTAAIAVSAIA